MPSGGRLHPGRGRRPGDPGGDRRVRRGHRGGNVINAGDITLPEDVKLVDDAELLVFNITFEEVAEVPEEGEEGTEDAVGEAGKEEGSTNDE